MISVLSPGPPAPPDRTRLAGPDPERAGFGARFVIASSFGSVLNPVNSSIIAVALVAIGRAFGVGTASTAWLVAALYLATAIGQPTMGRLADLLGPRRIYLAGTALVAMGGVLGYLAGSLPVLVVARVVIGFGTSAAYPAAMALVRRQSRRLGQATPSRVLGALAITGQASMAIGPTLGGVLIAAGGWRLTFLVNVPLAVLGVASVLAWLPADEPRGRSVTLAQALDPAGLILFAAGLSGLMVFLMDLAAPRWWLLGAAVGLLAALTARELRTASPFIDVRLLARNRALTVTYLRICVTMLIVYCFIYGWTLWLEQAAGRDAAGAGLLMTPVFVVAAAVSAGAARLRRLWPPLVAGSVALVAGSAGLLMLHARSPLWLLITIGSMFGISNGLCLVANQAAMYVQAPADGIGAAAGLMRTFIYLGAIASASLISLCYGRQATDAGLHRLAAILGVAALVLLAVTVADRKLARQVRA